MDKTNTIYNCHCSLMETLTLYTANGSVYIVDNSYSTQLQLSKTSTRDDSHNFSLSLTSSTKSLVWLAWCRSFGDLLIKLSLPLSLSLHRIHCELCDCVSVFMCVFDCNFFLLSVYFIKFFFHC